MPSFLFYNIIVNIIVNLFFGATASTSEREKEFRIEMKKFSVYDIKSVTHSPRNRVLIVTGILTVAVVITVAVGNRMNFSAQSISSQPAASQTSSKPSSSSSQPASSAVSSSSQSSSAASSGISLATAAPQVSLNDAKAPLSIDVSVAKQRVTITDAKGLVVKQFVCSTGLKGDETPLGVFRVSDRGKSFYSPSVSEGGYYWTRIEGDYLFHSVPFDKNYNMKPEEAAKLGTPASHGCVRLALNDAKWIYNNIPRGTVIQIH